MPQVHVDISSQSLTLCDEQGVALWCTTISSGKAGVGTLADSGQTPTGSFRVASRHGEGAPLRCAFRARVPYAIIPEQETSEQLASDDYILTRILTLDGLDAHNANTRARYIYIHGTSDVAHLGSPCSHGCIRLAPEAMRYLFDHCPLGTLVTIETNNIHRITSRRNFT